MHAMWICGCGGGGGGGCGGGGCVDVWMFGGTFKGSVEEAWPGGAHVPAQEPAAAVRGGAGPRTGLCSGPHTRRERERGLKGSRAGIVEVDPQSSTPTVLDNSRLVSTDASILFFCCAA